MTASISPSDITLQWQTSIGKDRLTEMGYLPPPKPDCQCQFSRRPFTNEQAPEERAARPGYGTLSDAILATASLVDGPTGKLLTL